MGPATAFQGHFLTLLLGSKHQLNEVNITFHISSQNLTTSLQLFVDVRRVSFQLKYLSLIFSHTMHAFCKITGHFAVNFSSNSIKSQLLNSCIREENCGIYAVTWIVNLGIIIFLGFVPHPQYCIKCFCRDLRRVNLFFPLCSFAEDSFQIFCLFSLVWGFFLFHLAILVSETINARKKSSHMYKRCKVYYLSCLHVLFL